MKEIDINSWPRKEIFDFFSATEKPFFSLSFRMDVSPVRRFAKERGLSFYYCMVWLVTEAMNRVKAFRYTVSGGRVFLLPRREPSFTDMKPGADYFHICTMGIRGGIEQFCAEAAERKAAQNCFINYSDERDNLIYISCLPWLDITGLTNEGELGKDDCIPRVSWGKFTEEEGKVTLGMAFEVNHRFVDGADIGRFATEFEKLTKEYLI